MAIPEKDPVEVLQEQKQYYLHRIRRIDIAIEALQRDEKGEGAQRKRSVAWKAEIRKIFEENPDADLSFTQVRDKLQSKGITQASEKMGSNSIMSTLSKLKNDNFLVRSDRGTYRKRSKNDPETGLFRE